MTHALEEKVKYLEDIEEERKPSHQQLLSEYASAQEKLLAKEREAEALNERFEMLTASVESEQAEKNALLAQLEAAYKERQNFEDQLHKLELECSKLREISEKMEDPESKELDDELKVKLSAVEEAKKILIMKCRELEGNLKQNEEQTSSLSGKCHELENKLIETERVNSDLTLKNLDLKKEADRLTADLHQVQAMAASLMEREQHDADVLSSVSQVEVSFLFFFCLLSCVLLPF